jgi:hypothetical protein
MIFTMARAGVTREMLARTARLREAVVRSFTGREIWRTMQKPDPRRVSRNFFIFPNPKTISKKDSIYC